jgi:hypothetical protein
VDPRAGLDDLEKAEFLTLPGLEIRPLSRPARSQSLYRLRYHGKCQERKENISTNIYFWSGFHKSHSQFNSIAEALRNKEGVGLGPEAWNCLSEKKILGRYSLSKAVMGTRERTVRKYIQYI